MAETHSSPVNEKPNLDLLFPELKKQHQTDTQIGGPRFMAPSTTAAALLGKIAREPARVPPPPSIRSRSVAAPPPAPSSRRVAPPPVVEPVVEDAERAGTFDEEEALATAPDASPKPLEPANDEYVDDGPTVLRPSPLLGPPLSARPQLAPPSTPKLPPPPSFAKRSAPSAGKLPPVPTPPPSSAMSSRPVSYPSLPKATPVLDDGRETAAPPPASISAPASRAASAASLVSTAAVPSRRYAPPTPPPASVPPTRSSRDEMTQVGRHPSLAPTSATLPPPPLTRPARSPSKAGALVFAAAATLGLCALGGFFVARGGAKALGFGRGTGAVAVTAAGPNGGAVSGVRVFVDGAIQCEGSPCKIADLSTGTHFISVDAPGFSQTAARAISIEKGAEAALHVDLVPQQGAPVAAPATAPTQTESKTSTPDDFKVLDTKKADKTEPAQKIERSARADKPDRTDAKKADPSEAKKADKEPAAAAPAGDATLNINSIPVASVVLDGRPMGSTPLVGVHVAPGAHSVVFIHPEKGRKASGTTVKAGGTATVAVRF